MNARRYAIILPACNEEACLKTVLDELRATVDPAQFEIAVGVNGSADRTASIARECGVLTAETSDRGYGYGCQAAIDALTGSRPTVDAYIFLAADGANDPADIAALVAKHRASFQLVLGSRTKQRRNWSVMGWQHVLANRFLGLWCGCLTGRFFSDLGPLRLIDRDLFDAIRLHEWTYGWTIEAQIRAVALGARIIEVPVSERRRIAGRQKVSRVSWRRTLGIGAKILQAGWRTRFSARGVESRSVAANSPRARPA